MVRTRIAPSPTGDPHIGTAYTALFNYALAKKNKGKFILRIEDTDRTRLVDQSEKKIIDSLVWLGLAWDEGPYRQSERLELYQEAAEVLIKKGAAYHCNCSSERLAQVREKQQAKGDVPRYNKKCRLNPPAKGPFVTRLKVPESGETSFEDLVRGKITFQNQNIDDAVILKSDGWPTYHLAVVVDDSDMKISHVIRAEEWLSSTPKHVLLYGALDRKLPIFAHLPLLRNPDKSKISKRKNPISIFWYKDQGYLPEALLNYLALMGWSMPDSREKFTLDEFIENFDLGRVDPAGPVFDLQKLDWLNGEWIRSLPKDKLVDKLNEYTTTSPSDIKRTLPLVQERIKKLSEFDSLTGYFYQKKVELDPKQIIPKTKNSSATISVLSNIEKSLSTLKPNEWNAKNIERVLMEKPSELGWSKTDLYQTIRYVETGSRSTPPLYETLETIGKEKTTDRLRAVVELLR
ncbi:glutamate--tRNA ligase [Patescibacteria group bacterium]|nr:glutamate--tRNA ligase [Patescibacteria group bacterium]